MQKKLILVLCVILGGLPFSCSEYILPKRVEVTGTVNLPVRIGVADFSARFLEALQEVFSGDAEGDEISKGEVYNVVYNKQTAQTFCIYIPIDVTEDLNPTNFLKTIDQQINGISPDPLPFEVSIELSSIGQPFFPMEMEDQKIGIPLSSIPNYDWPSINSISLANIAKYVSDIEFNPCDGTTIKSGIGINFYLEEVIPGLEMAIGCNDVNLNFSGADKYKPLKERDNIFGNTESEEPTILALHDYQDESKSLSFNVQFQSTGPDKDMLYVNTADLKQGDRVTIMKGEVRFFQNWTEATIDMWAALKAQPTGTDYVGKFPDTTDEPDAGFDLSRLKDYLDGEFTFDGLEIKMYMDNPVNFKMFMELKPKYAENQETASLYKDFFSVEKNLFVLSDYLENGNYTKEHLPGVAGEYNNVSIDKDAIADIFDKAPSSLTFEYTIEPDEDQPFLTVTPQLFNHLDEYSSINMALMIMLPMRLVAIEDGSVISFPDMFGKSNDLFGRDEDEIDDYGKLSKSVKIKKIKMTINFMDSIFSGGRLFIDGDRHTDPRLYPDGIKVSGRRLIMDFTDSQIEMIQSSLIKPNFWIKLNKNDTVTVPKNMGIMGVEFEMKGSVETGDILE